MFRSAHLAISLIAILMLAACSHIEKKSTDLLESQLMDIIDDAPGTIGIAVVSADDTITINNGVHYALMSVIKLHQSLAAAHELSTRNTPLDTLLHIRGDELNPDTWSPMLEDYPPGDLSISAAELIRYALISSDNNASNLLFSHVATPEVTDKYVRSLATDTAFSIRYSEAEMQADNELSYLNFSTSLSAALLIKQVFTAEILPPAYLSFIRKALTEVTTGQDRIGKPVIGKEDILFAHKTGSGYRNSRGELMAFNDVGYFRMPDGRDYALAVMIRDFAGSEEDAAELMSKISEIVFDYFNDREITEK